MAELTARSPDGPVVIVVDDEDVEFLRSYRWNMTGGTGSRGKYASTSAVANGKRTTVYMHRMVAHRAGLLPSLTVMPGQPGRWSTSIDHINGNKLDNRRANLRVLDRPRQMRNPNDAVRSTNTSGHRGVSYVKGRVRFGKPWMAYVTVNYKTKNLGWYATADEAVAARQAWDSCNGANT